MPAILRSQNGGPSPNNRLNLALVGVGGRGTAAVEGLAAETYVAFCDVDDKRAAQSYESHPDVPKFKDYREMFAAMGDKIDGVVISTPDHMHFPIAMTAIALGKHVYCEKPLTHTIEEARLLTAAAKARGVITQMGNQGHSNEGTRLLKEWIEAGVLGEVQEIHSWTDRPIWPQGLKLPDHTEETPPIPETLDWDLWLGVAAARDYDRAYAPFRWRGWWDFGCGALGDMACHVMDAAYWSLDLGPPSSVNAIAANGTQHSCPVSSVVTYQFPGRGSRAPLKWMWYDGGLRPSFPADFELDRKLGGNGSLVIGSEASVITNTYNSSLRVYPETRMREIVPKLPAKTLPRVQSDNHHAAWADAIRDGRQPASSFDYSGPFTETVLLGVIASRVRRHLDWNAADMSIPNLPEAEQYLRKTYRPGFLPKA